MKYCKISKRKHTSTVSGVGVGYGGTQGCSGGGHGGGGGTGQNQDYSGIAHGSYTKPNGYGYNGGHSVFPHLGGRGGGRLIVRTENFTVDGYVTAHGGDWRSVEAGGGSGGAIWYVSCILST